MNINKKVFRHKGQNIRITSNYTGVLPSVLQKPMVSPGAPVGDDVSRIKSGYSTGGLQMHEMNMIPAGYQMKATGMESFIASSGTASTFGGEGEVANVASFDTAFDGSSRCPQSANVNSFVSVQSASPVPYSPYRLQGLMSAQAHGIQPPQTCSAPHFYQSCQASVELWRRLHVAADCIARGKIVVRSFHFQSCLISSPFLNFPCRFAN